MKKVIIACVLLVGLFVGFSFLPAKEIKCDYLRLHIRANSNAEIDQNVKFDIKDRVIEFLTPHLCNVESKQRAIEIVEEYNSVLKSLCLNVLAEKNLDYKVNIKITNEHFPTREYCNTVLDAGFYDAVIIELGEGMGENWWGIMYPPLCFVNKNENTMQIKYKSIICEWWTKIFG